MHICGLVKLAEQREAVTKLDASATPGEGRRTAWVTAEAMERWLVEVGFVEELFGSSMHVELVSLVRAPARQPRNPHTRNSIETGGGEWGGGGVVLLRSSAVFFSYSLVHLICAAIANAAKTLCGMSVYPGACGWFRLAVFRFAS